MKLMANHEQVVALKKLIKNPGQADPRGRTELDRRANEISRTPNKYKDNETEIVKELSGVLEEFSSPDLSTLVSYIKQADLPVDKIASEYLKKLRSDKNGLDLFQRTELLQFLLRTIPEYITYDDIETKLYGLKETDPWLYASLLTKKFPHKGFDFVTYLINDNRVDFNSLLHLTMYWFDCADSSIINRIEYELEPLTRGNKKFHKVIQYKLKEAPKVEMNDPVMVLISSPEFEAFKETVISKNKEELEYA